jgi:hypothetical protein
MDLTDNKALLAKIRSRIPEFDAECCDGGWVWTFRCAEQQTDSSDTFIDCFIDFAGENVDDMDEMLDEMQGLNDDQDDNEVSES